MTSQNKLKKDIAALNFEDALKELEQIVQKMESGQIPLDDALLSYEKGILLKQHCEKKLQDAQHRIQELTISKDGDIVSSQDKDNL